MTNFQDDSLGIKPRIMSPITYWGGKKNMLRHILPIIPSHRIYVEVFCGGGAVFWAKEPAHVEIVNDLNGMVANFYKVIKQDFKSLQKEIQATPFARELYEHALYIYYRPQYFTDVERAWAFWIACNQGWGGKIGTWGYGTSDNKRELSISRKRDDLIRFCLNNQKLELFFIIIWNYHFFGITFASI